MGKIAITPTVEIDTREIKLEFIRSPGPGGQHVNTAATAVQLRFNVQKSGGLTESVRQRIIKNAGKMVTEEGILIITARRFRSQERNRHDALNRLINLIKKSLKRPKVRKKTRPSLNAKKKRLAMKSRRSELKQLRKPVKREVE